MVFDLAIIGGGPAGLMAAAKAVDNGLHVVLVEESHILGGQLKQQPQIMKNLPTLLPEQSGIELAHTLIERLTAKDITVLLKHTMIGVYKNGSIGVTNGTTTFPIKAKKILVTTGASEEAALFPGWTMPGVMTIGAAQILLNREHVMPGKNAIILGFNSFSYEVVNQLLEHGITIHAVIEKQSEENADMDLLDKFKALQIPVFFNSFIEKLIGKQEVEKAIISCSKKTKEYFVDLICVSNGLIPISDCLELLGCNFTIKEELGGRLPIYGSSFETTQPSVYVGGNAAGITCIGGVLKTSEIAVTSISESLGMLRAEEASIQRKLLWKELSEIENGEFKKAHDARVSLINNYYSEYEVPYT